MPKFMEGYAARLRVPPGARDVLVFDDALPGFFIRKFQSGKASYGVKYNVGAQQRRHLGCALRPRDVKPLPWLVACRPRSRSDSAQSRPG